MNGKYFLALFGQAFSGIAIPFTNCVPTRISQQWFNDEQRSMATILLSQPLGTLLGQLLTPLIVTNVESVSIMNIIWFVPAGLGAILALWKVGKCRNNFIIALAKLSSIML